MLREVTDPHAYNADLPLESWEVPSYRCTLPASLVEFFGVESNGVGISEANVEKVRLLHAQDWPAFQRIGMILDEWEYRGISRKKNHLLELYFNIDGIWRTAVIGRPRDGSKINELVTFHRLRPSKVFNRSARSEIEHRRKE